MYQTATGLALNAFAFSLPFEYGSSDINLKNTSATGCNITNRMYCEMSGRSSSENREVLQANEVCQQSREMM